MWFHVDAYDDGDVAVVLPDLTDAEGGFATDGEDVVVDGGVVEGRFAADPGRPLLSRGVLCLSMEIFFIILLIILTVYYRALALGRPISGGLLSWPLAALVWLNGTATVRSDFFQ